jgi:hypothetical protein
VTARIATRLEMVELTGRGAQLMIALYFVTMAVLAVWSIEGVSEPVAAYVAVALFGVACVLGVRDRGDRISAPVATAIVAVGVANTILVSWFLIETGYTQWYLGAAVVSLFYLCLRGRIVLAWVGLGLLAVVIALWGATTDYGLVEALFFMAKQVPVVIVATLTARGLRRTGDEIERLNAESSARATAEAIASATARERQERFEALGDFATPLLERLATGAVPTAEERLEFALAEAELRDGLRAPSLALPEVRSAARSARMRGVEVVLLDDSDPGALSAGDLARAAARISALINESSSGRVTARLLPSGRSAIATIVVDGADHQREDVAAG